MIKQLGFKRVLVLLILLGAVCAGIFFSHFIFGPQMEESQRQLSKLNNENSTLQSELDKMRADFVDFEKQKTDFDRITRLGFFNNQDRVNARERLDTIRQLSKVLSARYEIKAAVMQPDENELQSTGFVMMQTAIILNISALDDLDVYRFLYYLTYGFPGHISINSLRIERGGEVTPEVLKKIGTGNPPEIIKATIELDWRTLARKDDIENRNTSSPVTNAVNDGTQVRP